MYSKQLSNDWSEQYLLKHQQYLQEAEQKRLANEAKQGKPGRNLRQKLGFSLVKLGERLVSQTEPA